MSHERGKNNKASKIWVMVCSVIAVSAVTLLIITLFGRRVTIAGGDEPQVIKMTSMTCTIENYLYPFFTYDDSDRKELKIVTMFSDDGLTKVSLQQMLYYDDTNKIAQSSAANHAAMNNSFGKDGLKADALGASYAELDFGLRFGLYEIREKINEEAAQYFLLNRLNDLSYDTVKSNYENIGMKCIDKD